MKHGKWIKKVDDSSHVPYEKVVCSICGKEAFHDESYGYYDDTEYCHHCGAKMDGEEMPKKYIDAEKFLARLYDTKDVELYNVNQIHLVLRGRVKQVIEEMSTADIQEKKMTNAEKLIKEQPELVARYITTACLLGGECENCPFNTIKDCSNEEAVKEWLESEVEGEEDDKEM